MKNAKFFVDDIEYLNTKRIAVTNIQIGLLVLLFMVFMTVCSKWKTFCVKKKKNVGSCNLSGRTTAPTALRIHYNQVFKTNKKSWKVFLNIGAIWNKSINSDNNTCLSEHYNWCWINKPIAVATIIFPPSCKHPEYLFLYRARGVPDAYGRRSCRSRNEELGFFFLILICEFYN